MSDAHLPTSLSFVRWTLLTSCFGIAAFASNAIQAAESVASDKNAQVVWPQWRGGTQQGVAPSGDYPVKWSEADTTKCTIPGSGASTPIVVGNRAFLTSGVDGKNHLLGIDLDSLEITFQTSLGEDRGNKHRKGSGSNPSPVTDGSHVVSYFRSGDLACCDLNGKVVWKTNLQERFGEDTLWWDLGSSPMIVDGLVVVAVMQTGPSYIVAFDIESGEMAWKDDRMVPAPEEAAQSYSTPLATEIDGKKVVAVMGADHLTLTDAKTGQRLGTLGGFNPNQEKYYRSIASPVITGNVIACPYSRGGTLTGVDMEALIAAGEDAAAAKAAILWERDDVGSDVPTPAAKDGVVYVMSDGKQDRGTLYALSAETGETLWQTKLERTRASYSSSPLIVGDRLYITDEAGVTSVVENIAGDAEPKLLQTNEVEDDEQFTVASPVPFEDGLLLRTKNHLYKVEG
ncbi:outer membrane protein assembly factor BamB family protein [Rhodopirellula halodulae]|uniref:outer membrane protein assembly factor BamB family protein n=1 Tax=Rhodopirellula halodulae TaxID=2894198 RepID=UPI001E57A57E|nr:PQQ-binding-like beta-propeller repeat protein [Rhodopirellula sp. JC737]MCC9656427.1 PQQ-binding-like beta-propeller repeat protein [Rhodopirellula sp. JC737]